MLNLKWNTPKEWVEIVLNNFDSFLLDHASCERKASSTNMSLVVKYPNRTKMIEPLIKMALEELEHFHQVYKIIEKRGLILIPDEKDQYVNYMLRYLRITSDERLLDRLLLSGIIEARGCERLNMISNALEDKELKNFYTELTKCEARHHSQFINLANLYFDKETISKRMEELLTIEAEAIQSVPLRPTVH